jgi:uncharacterized protein YuzE
MKILNYDADVDVLTIKFGGDVFESDELEPGIIVDYDTDGAIVAIEVMDLSKRIEKPTISATASHKTISYPKKPSSSGKASSVKPHGAAANGRPQERKAKPRSKG